MTVTCAGSILNVHFSTRAPRDYREVAGTDVSLRRDLYLGLLDRGVYTTPRGMINLSTVMTDDDLAAVTDAYAQAFAEIAGELP